MNVLFVCSGNYSRSIAAEFLLRHKLQKAGITNVSVSSVGTEEWGRHERDPKMAALVKEKYGIELTGHTTYMSPETLDSADIILVMSEVHINKVKSLLRYDHWNRISLFRQYALNEEGGVTDPVSGTDALYRHVFELIDAGCDAILAAWQA